MSQSDWQQVATNFDPTRLPQPAWRIPRTGSPADKIIRTLERPAGMGTPRILLHGTVGTGKTTELHRIAEARAAKDLVVFLDIEGYFEALGDKAALQKVSSWEICFLAAASMVARAEQQLGFSFDPARLQALSSSWQKLAAATSTLPVPMLDVAAFAKGLLTTASLITTPFTSPGAMALVGGLAASSAMLDSVKDWKVPAGRSEKTLGDQAPEIQNLINAINRLIGDVQAKHQRVLFILDGLDRIRERQRACDLFIESQLLQKLVAPVVVTAPYILRNDIQIGSIEGWRSEFLVNEPVLDGHDTSKPGKGLQVFRQLYDRRVAELTPDLLSPSQVETLARASGGRARAFVSLVREVALKAFDEQASSASDAIIAETIDEARRSRERGLHAGHIKILKDVLADPAHRLPESPLTPELLNTFALLPYPNESEWYYPHYLLTLKLLR